MSHSSVSFLSPLLCTSPSLRNCSWEGTCSFFFFSDFTFNRIFVFSCITSNLFQGLWWGGTCRDVFCELLQRVSSLSSVPSVCHSVGIKNPVTYKSIRKVLPAESIYPIPIVRKFKMLRKILFQELLFKTVQSLFRVKSWYLEI